MSVSQKYVLHLPCIFHGEALKFRARVEHDHVMCVSDSSTVTWCIRF